jgi:hypothetical protein
MLGASWGIHPRAVRVQERLLRECCAGKPAPSGSSDGLRARHLRVRLRTPEEEASQGDMDHGLGAVDALLIVAARGDASGSSRRRFGEKVAHHASTEETGSAEHCDHPPRSSCLRDSIFRFRHSCSWRAPFQCPSRKAVNAKRRPSDHDQQRGRCPRNVDLPVAAPIALSSEPTYAESDGSRAVLLGSRRASHRSPLETFSCVLAWRTPGLE